MMKQAKKKKWGLMLFIVVIMIGTSFSFVFFGFSPATEKAKQYGVAFVNNGNVWIAKINGKNAAFSFLPNDVEGVPALDDALKMLHGKFEIDVTSDLNSTYKEQIALAQHQMWLTLEQYNIYLRKGFTANNTFSLPIITCNDSTLRVPVIYFRHGNTTNIHSENNCIIADAASSADFIKVKDRLLYGILDIIK